jgi:hypothetical protein
MKTDYNADLKITKDRFSINPMSYEANRFQGIYEETQKNEITRVVKGIEPKCEACIDSGIITTQLDAERVSFVVCTCEAGKNIFH